MVWAVVSWWAHALGLADVVLAFSGWVGDSRGTAQMLRDGSLPQASVPTATPTQQHRDKPYSTDTRPPPPTWTFTPTDTATLTPSSTPALSEMATSTDTSTPTLTETPTRSVPGPASSAGEVQEMRGFKPQPERPGHGEVGHKVESSQGDVANKFSTSEGELAYKASLQVGMQPFRTRTRPTWAPGRRPPERRGWALKVDASQQELAQ